MPMRWTADKDQLMFLLFLKTHNVSINYQSIAEAWPSDQGEKPTPRAISERLIKMRKTLAASSGPATATAVIKSSRGINSTPSKPKPVRLVKTPTSKRKRDDADLDADDSDDVQITSVQRRRPADAPRSSPTPAATTGGPVVAGPSRAPSTAVQPSREFSTRPRPSPASRAPRDFAAAFAARTPLSMEPTIAAATTTATATATAATPTAGMRRLSVSPAEAEVGSRRSVSRRSMSRWSEGVKSESVSEDDDDALRDMSVGEGVDGWGVDEV